MVPLLCWLNESMRDKTECNKGLNYAFMPHKRDANKPTIGTFGGRVLSLHRERITMLEMLPGTVQADIR